MAVDVHLPILAAAMYKEIFLLISIFFNPERGLGRYRGFKGE